MTNSKPLRNPLTTLWNILGTIGGILALSNMMSTWLQDLHAWKGFLLDVFTAYRAVVEPISHFLFGWLPFEMWVWVGDYVLFGGIVTASFFKAMARYEFHEYAQQSVSNYIWTLIFILAWPLALYQIGTAALSEGTHSIDPGRLTRLTLQWLSAILLGVFIVFSLNVAL